MISYVDTGRVGADDPQLLPKTLSHRPLAVAVEDNHSAASLGYLLAAFFEYYAEVFPFEAEVVCTTHPRVMKSVLHWETSPSEDIGRPPFFHMALKDPYGLDNVARNVDAEGAAYIRDCFRSTIALMHDEIKRGSDASKSSPATPADVFVEILTQEPPRPAAAPPVPLFLRTQTADGVVGSEEDAGDRSVMYELKRREFDKRRAAVDRFGSNTVRSAKTAKAAVKVASSVGSWLRSDSS
jgi:hypothetical protein